ncbi:MAG: metalloregulator ArsR/SmtB family transcription factor [Candidatus Lokiarchaeota archaeon]|nr:metalloregulator ArsR/SmtB family transcription factor [Candidatus Lokiarchaeota archaeon]
MDDDIQTPIAREMALIFKALADESRLRVIGLLLRQREVCVSDIAKELGLTTSSVSHHLGLLTRLGFVDYTRDGKFVYYSVTDDCIKDIIQRVRDHVRGN